MLCHVSQAWFHTLTLSPAPSLRRSLFNQPELRQALHPYLHLTQVPNVACLSRPASIGAAIYYRPPRP